VIENSFVSFEKSIKDVLVAINAVPAGIAFVVNDNNQLQGVVTDGDIRRLLIRGVHLSAPLAQDMIDQDFVFGKQGEDLQALLRKSDRKVRIIPIVDENMVPIDYFQYDHRTHFTPVAEPDLKGKEFEYLTDAFLSTWISSRGKYIDRFEADFAKYCGTKFGVATSNGTTALHLALEVLGVGEGDEVIIPDLTFAATINTVLHTGATPVLVDIEEEFWTIDPKEIEKAITPKTKAIIPVHLYGQPCDMDAIMQIAKKHNLYVVEDCAEAHGAEFNGKKVGSFGDINCFSFFANKIVTCGEGGICLTDNPEWNERLRIMRDHGMDPTRRYYHKYIGYNYRMTNLQAAIGCAQIERIDEIIKDRFNIEAKYKDILGTSNFVWQSETDSRRKRVVWLVSCLNNSRDRAINRLKETSIDTRPFFIPLSEMDVYQSYKKMNPISLRISKLGLNLPTVGRCDPEELSKVIDENS
jgi:perosamine synthetase